MAVWIMPLEVPLFKEALFSAFELTRWYAREHVLLCLVPAFFIAGVIAVFVSREAVITYLGAGAKKWISYAVASVSGTVLAVCSCTILPLFSGIYKRGAGLGPAVTFLYSGPAINIMAIILTARVLGFELGVARIVGAVVFSVVIGLIMHFIYRHEETAKAADQFALPPGRENRPFGQTAFHFFVLVFILVFATWGRPTTDSGLWTLIFELKWFITGTLGLLLAFSLIYILKLKIRHVTLAVSAVLAVILIWPGNVVAPFITAVIALSAVLSLGSDESREWMTETWGFAKQILPLLAAGVLVAGFLLGSPLGGHGIIPDEWISSLVGGNSFSANFFASVVGSLMYFATLTEIPILQGLINAGMGKGPALALLLAGPALSLPNMLVIRGVIGTQKTVVYVLLVIIMATISGLIYGAVI